ncbi:MAG TPA: hypothetical protein V6C72_01910 [Chroococcales cyanobacterium]
MCVRMMTYENPNEAEVLKALWRPGAPLENTVFAILDPNCRPIARGARSPDWMFKDARDMANGLNEVSRHYRGNADPQGLPVVDTVRLGMNVAACDKLPLAIVVSDNPQDRQALANKLAPLAWGIDFIGKLTYTAGSYSELRAISGVRLNRGYLFVAPNEFGSQGVVTAQLDANASPRDLEMAMITAIDRYNPQFLEHQEHIRLGHQMGVSWTTLMPITDPHSPEYGTHGGSGGGGGGGGRYR